MTAYATQADLFALGLPAAALTGVASATLDLALEAASRRADTYFSRFAVPIASPNAGLKEAVCAIAAYKLMSVRGYSPENPDSTLRANYEDAIKWLERCAAGTCTPCAQTEDATPTTDEDAPLISTEEDPNLR